jgi:eukaryotic-like serine/threonine-protein kinase
VWVFRRFGVVGTAHQRADVLAVIQWDHVASLTFTGTERFAIETRLGEGGMGVVYAALDRFNNTRVALKVLGDLEPRRIARFKNEFRMLADVTHPNLVTLYELFSADERWFFTMELVEGIDLLTYVRKGPGGVPDVGSEQSASAREHATSSLTETLDDLAAGEAAAITRDTVISGPVVVATGPRAAPLREPGQFARLRAALRQLAEGVFALHHAGHLHRDIKPSNVMVGRDGRVVLLDFGIATTLGREPRGVRSSRLVGTPEYMSPEQTLSGQVTQASDLYAVGVMLYEVLTGRRPFEGSGHDVLEAKRTLEPIPPEMIADDVPADLAELCAELLARDPGRRPLGEELLERVGGSRPNRASFLALSPFAGPAPPLVGRASALESLNEAFAAVQAGHARVVCVSGPSGIGKTGLVVHFLQQIDRQHSVVALAGRCFEQESVPYKAVDQVVDELTRYLMGLPRDKVLEILPPTTLALARLFPVLRQLEVVVAAQKQGSESSQPSELRREAVYALRELLSRLGEQRQVVIYIDDIQWADDDSFELLTDLVRPPNQPSLLLIVSRRPEDVGGAAFAERVAAMSPPGTVAIIDLDRLSIAEARGLALVLLERTTVPLSVRPGLTDVIARESGGSPMFISELVQYVASDETRIQTVSAVALDDVLRARIDELPRDAKRLLQVVAIAGRRIPVAVAKRAADLADERTALKVLRNSRLVRTRTTGEGEEIETHHERIGEAAKALLNPDERADLHSWMALSLEAAGHDDPEPLAVHFEAAGQVERAAELYSEAADLACSALAFHRAIRLFQKALDLGHDPAAVQVRLADAYADAGLGHQAAAAYLQAAEYTNMNEALHYRRRAAEELLHSGRFDQGEALLREVLAAIHMDLAPSPKRAVWSLVWRRAYIRVRGLKVRLRDESAIPPAELNRLDICAAAAEGLALIDTIRAIELQSRHLTHALRAGEPSRVARALAFEAGFASAQGQSGAARHRQVVRMARRLLKDLDDPYLTAVVEGIAALGHYLLGEFRRARDLLEPVLLYLRNSCTGVAFELASGRQWALWVLYYLGEWGEMCRRQPEHLADARARGDVYGVTNFTIGMPAIVYLALDRADEAAQVHKEAVELWSQRGFHLQHWFALYAEIRIHLYEGDPELAWRQMEAQWSALSASMLRRIHEVRVESAFTRATVALSRAVQGHERVEMARLAERMARAMRACRLNYGNAQAALVLAGARAVRGDREGSDRHLVEAIELLDAADMKMHAAAARIRRGELIGGTEGEDLVAFGMAFMEAQGVVRPDRIVALLAP